LSKSQDLSPIFGFIMDVDSLYANSLYASIAWDVSIAYNEVHLNNITQNSTSKQGILDVTGIADYEWVPARIGCFGNKNHLFLKYQQPI